MLIGLNQIEVQKMRIALRAIPHPMPLRALIDSGAEVTCVDPAIVQALSLGWHGVVPANMPAVTGMTFSSLYRASVTILHPSGKPVQHFLAEDWLVCELPWACSVTTPSLAAIFSI